MDKAGTIERVHQEIINSDWARYFEVVKMDEQMGEKNRKTTK